MELGLRYPPSTREESDAHQARVALLAKDCAAIPPAYLEKACAEWARTKGFLPRASELIALAHSFLPSSGGKTYAERVRLTNLKLQDDGNPRGLVWILEGAGPNGIEGGAGMRLEFQREEKPFVPLSPDEIRAMARSAAGSTLMKLGVTCGYFTQHEHDRIMAEIQEAA